LLQGVRHTWAATSRRVHALVMACVVLCPWGAGRAWSDGAPTTPSGELHVRVRDSQGQFIPGVRIGVREATRVHWDVHELGGGGETLVRGLPLASHEVRVTGNIDLDPMRASTRAVALLSDLKTSARVDLAIDRTTILRLAVPRIDAYRRSAMTGEGFLVRVFRGDREVGFGGQDPWGRQTQVVNLPEDVAVDVFVNSKASDYCALLSGLRGGDTIVPVELRKGAGVRGFVSPVASGVRVWVEYRGGVFGAELGANGAFFVGGLPIDAQVSVRGRGVLRGKIYSGARACRAGEAQVKLLLVAE